MKTISTGGGFNALYMEHPLGRKTGGYFLITDPSGEQPPKAGGKAAMAWYSDDMQYIGYMDIEQWEQTK